MQSVEAVDGGMGGVNSVVNKTSEQVTVCLKIYLDAK